MQEKRLTNEEINDIRQGFSFLSPEFESKFSSVFEMAKKLNDSLNSLNTLDGMLICIKDKLLECSNGDISEEIDGVRLYLNEVIKEMVEL